MSEKNCVVVLTDAQEVKVTHCTPEADIGDVAGNVLHCDWVQAVSSEALNEKGLILLVDEDAKLKSGRKYINCIASSLYGTEDHGDPIIGDAMLVRNDNGGLHLFSESEARDLSSEMVAMREQAINSIGKALRLTPEITKRNEMRDEIDRGSISETPRRQPCAKKEEVR